MLQGIVVEAEDPAARISEIMESCRDQGVLLLRSSSNVVRIAPPLVIGEKELALGVATLDFKRNGKPNRVALHDLGLATGNLVAEATARGLSVHQMGGILPDRARETYEIPEGSEAVTGIAIGYAGDPDSLPEEIQKRDLAPRERKPQRDFVFGAAWREPF